MKKRTFAAVLWCLAVAYLWNLIATVAGISTAPSLLAGVIAGLIIAGDPMHRIWRQPDA